MKRKVPDVVFKTRVRDESLGTENPFRWQDLSSKDVFAGKRVVLFAVPGAFTPVCSDGHLPGYAARHDEFKALGIDQVICLAVNDAYTMFQWSKQQGCDNLFMLPDGNAEFTRKMGMLVDKSNLGYGKRSWRYSMLVDDGVIEKIFVEPGMCDNAESDPFEVSDAETMLGYLRQAKAATANENRAQPSAG